MKLSDVAQALNARCEGDGSLDVSRAVHPSEVGAADDLALAMDRDLLPLLPGSGARAAVIAEGAEAPSGLAGWIVVPRPRYAMAGLLDLFARPVHCEPGIHPMSVIDSTARLGRDVAIGPFVSIGPGTEIGDGVIILSNVSIGANVHIGGGTFIHPGVRVGDRVEIGRSCILHPNAAIGNDGFSFVTPEPGSVESAKAAGRIDGTNLVIRRINSIGTVIIGDQVEIGAGACIDRGTVTATRIGSGTKIDNLTQIGHNVEIGSNCMLCGQVGIAGSVRIGSRVVLAGKVGVADHVTIGDDVVVGACAGVSTNLPSRNIFLGQPAVPKKQFFEQIKAVTRLPRLARELRELVARVAALESGAAVRPPAPTPAED